ncbi:MAG: hypothetical protein RL213_848 [Bacteroidota bacterium]|jgi:hypothetical protein
MSARSDLMKNAIFFIAVLLSRLPFLTEGYGLDGDAWGVALTALKLKTTGTYEVSRFPGYPVQEFLSSLAVSENYFSLNFLTAVVSTSGVLAFVLALKELRFRAPYLAGAALASVPVLYINSTLPIDYTYSLALQLWALYLVVRQRPIAAGIVMGFAIGTRITSVALLLPLAMMLLSRDGLQSNLRRIFRFLFPAFLTGVSCYYPVYRHYGWEFLTYYDVPYPAVPRILYKFFVEVWGLLGVAAIFLGTALMFLPERMTRTDYLFPRSIGVLHVTAWIIAIDLYIIAFLKLPMEAGYLLPVLPFVLMLFGKYLIRPAYMTVCVLLVASPFFFSVSPADRRDAETPSPLSSKIHIAGEDLVVDALKGPVTAFESRRENAMRYGEAILARMDSLDHPAVVICGQWYNQLVAMNRSEFRGHTALAPHIGEEQILSYYSNGRYLYYLYRQDRLNREVKGADPSHYGAALFDR